MRDIRDQLAAYAELLDHAAPPLEELTTETPTRVRSRRVSAIGAALAGAVAVLVIVGGIAAISRRTTATTLPPDVSTSAAFTVPVPPIAVEMLNPQAVTTAMFSGWAHDFAGPGGVAVVDGDFHMLSSAYGGNVATVAYATSDDGVVWSQGSPDPVLDLAQAPWAPLELEHAVVRSLVVDEGGVWQLYFEIGWPDKSTETFRGSIGRATAGGPLGPWTFDELPVLDANSDRPWMAKSVASPSVIATETGLTMLFVGMGGAGGVIGVAESEDGSDWRVKSDPVFAASDEWERSSVSRVDLLAVDGGYAMIYAGDTTSRRGIAVSADLLEWFSHPDNPFLTTLELPRASVFDSEFVATPQGLLAFIENGGVRSESEVVVLRIRTDFTAMLAALVDES